MRISCTRKLRRNIIETTYAPLIDALYGEARETVYDAAITYCEDSLRLRPDRHGPWNNLGLAYLRSGNLEAARRCYEKAVELRPWFPHSLSGLSQTLRQLGLVEEARQTAMRIKDTAWRGHELGNLAVTMSVSAAARAEPTRTAP